MSGLHDSHVLNKHWMECTSPADRFTAMQDNMCPCSGKLADPTRWLLGKIRNRTPLTFQMCLPIDLCSRVASECSSRYLDLNHIATKRALFRPSMGLRDSSTLHMGM